MAVNLSERRRPWRPQPVPGPTPVIGRTIELPLGLPARAGCIHLGVVKELVPVLQELGADPERLIRDSGLDPCLFDDANNVISLAALDELLTLAGDRTRCRHIGLLIGQRARISSMGIVGGLMQYAETFGDALGSLIGHLHIQNRIVVPRLAVSGEVVMLSLSVYAPGSTNGDQIADAMLAVAYKTAASLCGPQWIPTEVRLPRTRPADPRPYASLFRAPLRFDEETAALVFPTDWLGHPIASADADFRRIFERWAAELESIVDTNFQDDVRRVLRTRLLSRRCSAADIAGCFAIHRRTLYRRLAAEGTDFKALADGMRFEIARQLLATRMPLVQVAMALGYAEAGAFTRAFQRWTGQTPTSWRTAHYPDLHA